MFNQGTGGHTREYGKRALHRAFRVGQRLKVDVLPRHFYSSVPDVRQLSADESWRQASEMPGVRGTDLDQQIEELKSWFTEDVLDDGFASGIYEHATGANGAIGYGPAEAQMLYAFIATKRPRRVVQVGAGVSTAVILAAAERHSTGTRVTCVDPYPTEYLQELAGNGAIDLLAEPAQTAALDVFTSLESGDLLFIDSTHTVKPGSEVNRMILEVLPRLKTGVVVHFHDITFPYDYQRDILDRALFFWTESTLLHAYLANNDRMRILVSGSMLQYGRVKELSAVLPNFNPREHDRGLDIAGDLRDFAGSTYLIVDQP